MNTWQLIAFDMDGTLLQSDKTISPAVLNALHEAVLAGKDIALSTGRPTAELTPYLDLLQDFHYAVLESGGLVYDLRDKSILLRHTLNPESIPDILCAIKQEDIMPQAMCNGSSFINAADLNRMDHYQMGVYQSLYQHSATCLPDVVSFIRDHASEIEKINLYHTCPEARERTFVRLQHLPVERTFAEQSSLEVSPPGVNKGSGLLDLCRIMGIAPQSVIAAGDADNDLPMMKAAGLGAAMGNAPERIRSRADVVVKDNDHDGCAEIIYKYLLNGVDLLLLPQ